jgi:tetratricopeptide (TPR) repeat protein
VSSVAFSPDDTRVATGSWDGTAKVWDAKTGTHLLELGPTRSVYSVAFSPDGTRIVTGGYDRMAKVWDARPGTPPLELKGHTVQVSSVAFGPDGTRIVTGSQDNTAKVWDVRTGAPLSELKGHTGTVSRVAFSRDGTRIVTVSQDRRAQPRAPWEWTQTAKVWDTRTGQELKGEPLPQTIANNGISPDGRFFAHPVGDRVKLMPLQLNEEEHSYRLLHTQPNLGRYRESYEAARAAKDDFATRFYFNLLPPAEQEIIEAQAAAEREMAAGRTAEALVYLAKVLAAHPEDTLLFQKVAILQAWFGQDKDLADTSRPALAFSRDTADPGKADRVVQACCLLPSTEKAPLEGVLALARRAVDIVGNNPSLPWYHLALGMAEYRSGYFAEADAALIAAASFDRNSEGEKGTAAFYRAMSLFQQGKKDEARKLATEAAARMRPLPTDEKNPLAGNTRPDDLILWLAYKEAKAMIQFDAAPLPKAKPDQK